MRITVDCGRHGMVTWELPDATLSEEVAQGTAQSIQTLCEPRITRFFKLLVATMLSGELNRDQGLKEIDEAITHLATNGHLRGRGTN